MTEHNELVDRIWNVIDTEDNADVFWYDDADALFSCMYSVCMNAFKNGGVTEGEMRSYFDYKKEQITRWIFQRNEQHKGKMKDFGDKRKLK